MAVRFLHSADWQIGKVFADLVDHDADKAALLKRERTAVVERLARLATRRQVDCVVVAGDVFDSQTVPEELLRRTLHAMAGFAGPWLLLPGNHDAALSESVWTRLLRLGVPGNVIPMLRAEPVLCADGRLAILPAPLLRRHESLDVSAALDELATPDGAVRVGVAHGSVQGRLPARSESYNEIAADRVTRARLDYLALGDWHGTLQIADKAWYSGTPEPDRFKEADRSPSGNVLCVEIDGPGKPPRVESIATGHFQWEKRTLPLHDAQDLELLDAALRGLHSDSARLLVDLTLTGSLPVSQEAPLRTLLADWQARLHLLRVHDEALLPELSDAELDGLVSEEMVRSVIAELRQQQAHGAEAGERARLALRLLLSEYRQLQSSSPGGG